MMAVALLKQSDEKRYAEMKLIIHDQFAFEMNIYPQILSGTYDLHEKHSEPKRRAKADFLCERYRKVGHKLE